MKPKAMKYKDWEINRMLHDEGLSLMASHPKIDQEVDRRISLGLSGPPIQVLQAYGMNPSHTLEKALGERNIFFAPVSDSEYSFIQSSTEPDYDYLQNYKRGKSANANGVYGERQFKAWCHTRGHIHLKSKHLSALFGNHPKKGDKKFWTDFAACAKKLSRRSLAAIKDYMRGKQVGLYGDVAGMADFFVIAGRRQFFVEVKATRVLKLSAVQQAALRFFEARGIKTRVWRSDSGVFDKPTVAAGNLTMRLSRRRQRGKA
jgi:hypothetical protein